MTKKAKNVVVSVWFVFLIALVLLVNILRTPQQLSYSERRPLAQFPSFSISRLLSGEWLDAFDKYTLDQFVFRDGFRTLKAVTLFNLFVQKDNHGIYVVGNHVYKMEYPLHEQSVRKAADKLNKIQDKYLEGMNVFYSVIPDKGFYAAEKNGYPHLDYDRMVEMMKHGLTNMTYIDLFDTLTLEDYYHTDPHWRQECLGPVVERITSQMGLPGGFSHEGYSRTEKYPFYGAYYGQSALPLKPDNLTFLTNKSIEDALVYYYDYPQYSGVYDIEKFGKMDSYDIFLSGPMSLITIENPYAESDKELIIFRDSYSSSLAPLLLDKYHKITLVDLRYLSSDKLGDFITFESQDVLFLYSTLVLNNSEMLK